jgi:hypothetical protein
VNIKYSILLFQMGKDTLLRKYEVAKSTAWPGYLIMEGEFPLLPRATTAWGCLVMPLLLTGTDLEEQPPSNGDMQAAVAAIMRKAVIAESSKSVKNLLTRWWKLAASPDELVAKKGPMEWPAQKEQAETGK